MKPKSMRIETVDLVVVSITNGYYAVAYRKLVYANEIGEPKMLSIAVFDDGCENFSLIKRDSWRLVLAT